MFGPHGTHLFVAGKFAARGGGFRGGATGGSSSVPVIRNTARAMLSCSSAGRLRTALSASSRSFVIGRV